MAPPYVALFCPSCGVHLNDFDTEDTPDGEWEGHPVDLGGAYTCGWCGVRTHDWNHIRRCRKTAAARKEFADQQLVADTEGVRLRLSRMVSDLGD